MTTVSLNRALAVDDGCARQLRSVLCDLLDDESSGAVMVSFAGVEIVGNPVMNLLLSLHQGSPAARERLALIEPQFPVMEVFRTLHFDKLFPVTRDSDSARRKLNI